MRRNRLPLSFSLALSLFLLLPGAEASAHPRYHHYHHAPAHRPWFRVGVPFAELTPRRADMRSPGREEWWNGINFGFGTNFAGPLDVGVDFRYLEPSDQYADQHMWEGHLLFRMDPFPMAILSPYAQAGFGLGRFDYDPYLPYDSTATPPYYTWGPNGILGAGVDVQPAGWISLSAYASYEFRDYTNSYVKFAPYNPTPWPLSVKEDGWAFSISARFYAFGGPHR